MKQFEESDNGEPIEFLVVTTKELGDIYGNYKGWEQVACKEGWLPFLDKQSGIKMWKTLIEQIDDGDITRS